jgi:hypothetical protein
MVGRAGRPLQYLADLVRGEGRAGELAQLLLDQVAQRSVRVAWTGLSQ